MPNQTPSELANYERYWQVTTSAPLHVYNAAVRWAKKRPTQPGLDNKSDIDASLAAVREAHESLAAGSSYAPYAEGDALSAPSPKDQGLLRVVVDRRTRYEELLPIGPRRRAVEALVADCLEPEVYDMCAEAMLDPDNTDSSVATEGYINATSATILSRHVFLVRDVAEHGSLRVGWDASEVTGGAPASTPHIMSGHVGEAVLRGLGNSYEVIDHIVAAGRLTPHAQPS